MRAAPAVSCARCTKENTHKHTGSAEAVRHSLRNGFTAYFALSPVTGHFCHRRSRWNFFLRKLDTSVGVSGPHDFAVRHSAARLASPKRPSHPVPNVRDDREAPLLSGRDARKDAGDLGVRSTASGCGRLARRASDGPRLLPLSSDGGHRRCWLDPIANDQT